MWKLQTRIVPKSLDECIEEGIPWVVPSRYQAQITKSSVKWAGPSALAHIIDFVGRDNVRAHARNISSPLYDCGLPVPGLHNSDDLLRILLDDKPVYIFRENMTFGLFMEDMTWIFETEEKAEAEAFSQKNVFLPLSFFNRMTCSGDLRTFVTFGIQHNAFRIDHPIRQVEVAIWTDLDETISGKVKTASKCSAAIAPYDMVDEPKLLPLVGLETSQQVSVEDWCRGYNKNVLRIMPIGVHRVSSELKSPLSELDWLYLDSPIPTQQVSLSVLGSYLQQIFPHETLKTAQDCATVLARYYDSQELDLVSAIGMPRICLPDTGRDNSRAKITHVADIPEIRSAVPDIKTVSGFGGVSSYVVNLLVRTAVVLHTMGGHVSAIHNRTYMYTAEALIYSMLKSSSTSGAEYVKPMVLMGALSYHRDQEEILVPEDKTHEVTTEEVLGDLPDDLFS